MINQPYFNGWHAVRLIIKTYVVLLCASYIACSDHKSDTLAGDFNRQMLLDPATCSSCHAEHYQDWLSSMHAHAADDPVFIAMNKRAQRETNGAIGSFCVNCHAPMAVQEGATKDGLNLADVPQYLKGVTCYACHNIKAIIGSHNNQVTYANDTVMRGEYSDPLKNSAHASAYSTLIDRTQFDSASVCGSCHDIVAPAGAHVERTFAEWQASAFASPETTSTCSECHMAESVNLQPIANVPNAPLRRSHNHTFPGVDIIFSPNINLASSNAQQVQTFLNTSLQSALCVQPTNNGGAIIEVILDNVAAGHKFTSGAAQDRRFWVELIAYKNNQIIYQTGVVAQPNNIVADTQDTDLWLIRDCIFDANNQEINDFWDAASYEANQLPTLSTFDSANPNYYATHIIRTFPKDLSQTLNTVPDTVSMRLLLQPIGVDLLNDLVQSGDLDAAVAAQMPTFVVGDNNTTNHLVWTRDLTQGVASYLNNNLPVYCISPTHLNVASIKTPAIEHVRCAP